MTAEYIKQSLLNSIQFLTDYKRDYSRHPETDYTRNRKIPFDKTIAAVLSFRGGTLTNDLLDFFGLDKSIPSSSAFIQQRAKIVPDAFEKLFEHFTHSVCSESFIRGIGCLLSMVQNWKSLQTRTIRSPLFPVKMKKSPITYFISMQRMIYFNIYILMPFFKNSEIRMNAVH